MIDVVSVRSQLDGPHPLYAVTPGIARAQRTIALPQVRQMTSYRGIDGLHEGADSRIGLAA